jgi:hypothetical protein
LSTPSQQAVTYAVRIESDLILLAYVLGLLLPLTQIHFDLWTPP